MNWWRIVKNGGQSYCLILHLATVDIQNMYHNIPTLNCLPPWISRLSSNKGFKSTWPLGKFEYESRTAFKLDSIALLLGLGVNPDLSLETLLLYLTIGVDKVVKEYHNRRNNCMRNLDCWNYRAREVERGCWCGISPHCRSFQKSRVLCWCGGTTLLRCYLPSMWMSCCTNSSPTAEGNLLRLEEANGGRCSYQM